MSSTKPFNLKLLLIFTSCSIFFIVYLAFINYLQNIGGITENKALASLTLSAIFETQLFYDVVFYIVAILLLHVFFGLFIFQLYRVFSDRYKPNHRNHLIGGLLFFCASALWLMQLNSTLYPKSIYAHEAISIFKLEQLIPFSVVSIALVVLIAVKLFELSKFLYHISIILVSRYRTHAVSLISIFGLLILFSQYNYKEAHGTDDLNINNTMPNVIIIGIDSLRPDHVFEHKNDLNIPNVKDFLQHASVFKNAITPLARTYPSWVSILTGKNPVSHGARANLIHTKNVDYKNNIAHLLKKQGYTTVYAIDERRFNNIDENYGFDHIIGPKTGAGDFLLGTINDLPLSNLISNTLISRWLFPYSYANRAAYKTYKPETFTNLIKAFLERESSNPLFLNIHLCLPHWPYDWSETGSNLPQANSNYDKYLRATNQVDMQLGNILKSLKSTGHLEKAIVVLLSDHGEAFQFDANNLSYAIDKKINALNTNHKNKVANTFGHGTNIFLPSQNSILLSFRFYGDNSLANKAIDTHTSLIDIAPTLHDYLNLPNYVSDYDGTSMLPVIEDKQLPNNNRYLFLETGFNPDNIFNTESINVKKAISQSGKYYSFTDKGNIVLKQNTLTNIISAKQRGVKLNNWLMIFSNNVSPPILVNTKENIYWHYSDFSKSKAPIQSMLSAFCLQYTGEFKHSMNYCNKPHSTSNNLES